MDWSDVKTDLNEAVRMSVPRSTLAVSSNRRLPFLSMSATWSQVAAWAVEAVSHNAIRTRRMGSPSCLLMFEKYPTRSSLACVSTGVAIVNRHPIAPVPFAAVETHVGPAQQLLGRRLERVVLLGVADSQTHLDRYQTRLRCHGLSIDPRQNVLCNLRGTSQ